MKKLLFSLSVVGSVLFSLVPVVTSAQGCGNFIYPGSPQDFIGPIIDCDNPFAVSTSTPNTSAEYVVYDEVVNSGAVVELDATTGTAQFDLLVQPAEFEVFISIFRHEGDDYRQLRSTRDGPITITATGTYTFVTDVEIPIDSLNNTVDSQTAPTSTVQSLLNWLIPTAHAQPIIIFPFVYETYAHTFTVIESTAEPELEPVGASSVLFLPGIQASRLYTDGILGSENQLWEPNRDNDVEKLAMTESGQSSNDIYTKDVIDEIFVFGNIYKSFLKQLEGLKEEGSIHEFLPFAYDWRYDVFTVATEPVSYPDGEQKFLLAEVRKLAAESYTGKVTIIAHSNGGLVAKALLHEYGDDELAGLVDKVVLVGTPQLGTPKAIGSLLHGLDQDQLFETLITQSTARRATQNMPGAYGLLPTSKYFEGSHKSVITADDSLIAAPVSSYGDLGEYDNFIDFLGDKKATRNEVITISQPITLSADLLQKTIQNQQTLDNWTAPAGVEVYEVAGTGLVTIDGFHYREFSCRDTNPSCVLRPFLKPVPSFTTQGDGTVVLSSAAAYEGDKTKFVVNLPAETIFKPNAHANLTESKSVKQFLESVILYPYLTDSLVSNEFSEVTIKHTIIAVHSPVSLSVKNSDGLAVGKLAGVVTEEIAGASYFEFAGSKYIVVPAEEDVEVLLQGEAQGRYSVTIEELSTKGEQVLLQEIVGATSTAGMVAEFDCAAGVCGEVVVDYNSDGESDVLLDWAGDYQELNQSVAVVKESGGGQSSGTRVSNRSVPSGAVAGATTVSQSDELLRMWKILLEIQVMIEELKLYYNLK